MLLFSRGSLMYLIEIYLDLPNVIIHECGHALMTKLSFGSVRSVRFHLMPSVVMEEGALGQAEVGNRGKIGEILTGLGGYVIQGLFFSLMTYLAVIDKSVLILPLFLIVYLITNLIATEKSFWQNSFLLLVVGFGLYLYKSNPEVLLTVYNSLDKITTVFYGWYALGLAHQIGIVLTLDNSEYWDGMALKEYTFIPAFIWKVLFLIVLIGSYFSYYLITNPVIVSNILNMITK
jgi:hypothetical protein